MSKRKGFSILNFSRGHRRKLSSNPEGGEMARFFRRTCIVLGVFLFGQIVLSSDLRAFSISERNTFTEGPYIFKLEVQVNGSGSFTKKLAKVSSLKVKIKNEKASSATLKVKTIRVFPEPKMYSDIETQGFPIAPRQWVTKFYRLEKAKQPIHWASVGVPPLMNKGKMVLPAPTNRPCARPADRYAH